MNTVLFVDCCISQKGYGSCTAQLCRSFLSSYANSHPAAHIDTLDLKTISLAPFTSEKLNLRDRLLETRRLGDPMFALANQFASADYIVIGAPYWDLTFPAQLKLYIEHISVRYISFLYDERGRRGICKAQKLIYLSTSGEEAGDAIMPVLEWEALCGTFGIRTFDHIIAGGLDVHPDQAQMILGDACRRATALGRIW